MPGIYNIPGTTSDISIQKSTHLGTAKILQNPQTPSMPLVGPQLEGGNNYHPREKQAEIRVFINLPPIHIQGKIVNFLQ